MKRLCLILSIVLCVFCTACGQVDGSVGISDDANYAVSADLHSLTVTLYGEEELEWTVLKNDHDNIGSYSQKTLTFTFRPEESGTLVVTGLKDGKKQAGCTLTIDLDLMGRIDTIQLDDFASGDSVMLNVKQGSL